MRRQLLLACALLAPTIPSFAATATIGDDTAESATHLRPGTVTVQASAHRRLPNTVADIAVAIEIQAHDVAAVTRQLGEKSQALLAFLRGQGAQRLSTSAISVQPQTHSEHGGPEVIVGYVGREQVTFRTGAAQAGELISGCLAHGANTLQGNRFSPTEEETDKAHRELAVEATRIALDQARAVADAASEHMLGVREINVVRSGGFPQPMMAPLARMAAAAPAPVAAEAGEQDVSVTVDVKIAIGRGS